MVLHIVFAGGHVVLSKKIIHSGDKYKVILVIIKHH